MTNEEAIKELEKIAQFKTEAVSDPVYMGIRALERQIPKEPIIKGINDYGEPRKLCPVCHCEFDDNNNYCGVCGQRLESEPQFGCKDGVCEIDWSDQE